MWSRRRWGAGWILRMEGGVCGGQGMGSLCGPLDASLSLSLSLSLIPGVSGS